MANNKVIAFYLPQFHPTPNNDKWWGKGFTEWTNVGKAKPLFRGHYQPKVPADLGYYDLRLPQIREQQAQLAKEAGLFGFCYYHYWFGNGREELEMPFDEVVRTGTPDFPFMLCWANESWHRKFWSKDGTGTSKEVLAEQIYPGERDNIAHFYRLLDAFNDKRYIRIDGKIAFMVYRPFNFKDVTEFIRLWNSLALKEKLPGFHFIAYVDSAIGEAEINQLISLGFSAVTTMGLWMASYKANLITRVYRRLKRQFGRPPHYDYSSVMKKMEFETDLLEPVYPTVLPNWDHSPRSKGNALILTGSTPIAFGNTLRRLIYRLRDKKNKIIFLKSWNEWGEGNYVEPDLKYGKGYINELSKILNKKSGA